VEQQNSRSGDKENVQTETAHCGLLFSGSESGTPMAFMFENLQVYQKAVDFADETASLSETFPGGYYFLVEQLNRAALAIATNLAEGNGRFTKADRKSFFIIARGSAQECVPLLEIAFRRGFLAPEKHIEMKSRLEEIARMLSGLITAMDTRER
jgi:four helix bundle protein